MAQQNNQTLGTIGVKTQVAAPALLALLLGAFLIIGTGFAHSDAIHSAAHDSRHSFAFPCH
jgi:cobalt transporter subunit CbtB|tara:strand:- start:376 stop:558 length:183 start_codon:yes stop_codon:yes gene_type:complete